ncbi:MAG: alpha/beta hydrolase [Desulfobulbaceae bacterium]|nr:alpha/beta hydrolase [Desulfobulbaceae bacterium]
MSNLHKLDRPEILDVMFHPRQIVKNTTPAQAVDLDFEVEPGVAIGCRLFTADKSAPLLFFFHGNGEIVPDYDDIGPLYIEQGLNFLVADYRGYGWSGGTPSAVSLISDARTMFGKATAWLTDNGYSGTLFVMGRSLGSACAIDLALEFQESIGGLIIESGFAETMPLMQTLGIDLTAMGIAEGNCFNNLEKIRAITKPIYILHGQRDSLIPLRHAQQLHAAAGARTKELQIVPGADHNSMIAVTGKLYFQAIRGFIAKITGDAGRRDQRKRRPQQ